MYQEMEILATFIEFQRSGGAVSRAACGECESKPIISLDRYSNWSPNLMCEHCGLPDTPRRNLWQITLWLAEHRGLLAGRDIRNAGESQNT